MGRHVKEEYALPYREGGTKLEDGTKRCGCMKQHVGLLDIDSLSRRGRENVGDWKDQWIQITKGHSFRHFTFIL